MTYSVAHIIVACSVHVSVGPLLEPWGLNGGKFIGTPLCFRYETLTSLNSPLVLEIEETHLQIK